MRKNWSAGLLAIAGALLASGAAGAQVAGQSSVDANLLHNNAGLGTVTYYCDNRTGWIAVASESCATTQVPGGTGSSSAYANSASRSVSASATYTMTSAGEQAQATGTANQRSALAVSNDPQPGDVLVFHLLTSQSAFGSGGTTNSQAEWGFAVNGALGNAYGLVQEVVNGDGTVAYQTLHNATQTASGYDLTLPFSAGSVFSYILNASAYAYSGNSTPGAAVSSAISAQVTGVDVMTSNGTFVTSAVFDPNTGLGSITLAPEPTSFALLGTGLVALVPFVRRRRPR